MYNLSFCAFLGDATVKTFSSVNQMKLTLCFGYLRNSVLVRTRTTQPVCCSEFLSTPFLNAFQTQLSMHNGMHSANAIPVSRAISLKLLCVPGLFSWLWTNCSTFSIFSAPLHNGRLPLPVFLALDPVSSMVLSRGFYGHTWWRSLRHQIPQGGFFCKDGGREISYYARNF